MDTCALCEDCPFETKRSAVIPEIHEIHVTVRTDDVSRFRSVCEGNAIKPIVIAFQDESGARGQMTHVMTSQRVFGDRNAALAEAGRVLNVFANENLESIRLKIETSLGPRPDDNGYFESHLAFRITTSDVDRLRTETARIGELRMSRNAFKKTDDTVTMMVTKRDYHADEAKFRTDLALVRHRFEEAGFFAEREIAEWCWLDENPGLDAEWDFVRAA